MKSISFKNFRRFADFPEFKFGDITILVGGNNAGKSTLVKALLLVLDNLKTMRRDSDNVTEIQPIFRFDKNQYHDLSIGSFAQAICRNAQEDANIEFSLNIDDLTFSLGVSGSIDSENDGMTGKVETLTISEDSKGIKFVLDFSLDVNGQSMQFHYQDPSYQEILKKLSALKEKQKELNKKLSLVDDDDIYEVPNITHDISVVKNGITKLTRLSKEMGEGISLSMPIIDHIYRTHGNIIEDLLENFIILANGDPKTYEEKWPIWATPLKDVKKTLKQKEFEIQSSLLHIGEVLSSIDVIYMQAHGVKQQTLYRIGDTSDFIASTLTDFVASNAYKNKEIRKFIRKWMQWFNIGYDFKLSIALDEAFTVSILESNGDTKGFPMAHLGMGSIQLMILLFGLATQMKKYDGAVFAYPTIVLEEPEQNLHPALQSKLADLFSELTRCHSFRFIIETHSEYLIRRSQVLMADPTKAMWYTSDCEEVEDIERPFKVYYFPSAGTPYDMQYREDGRFAEEFGSGFFDEASNLAISLF